LRGLMLQVGNNALRFARLALGGLFDLLWPARCLLCGRSDSDLNPDGFCAHCRDSLATNLGGVYCLRCGRTFEPLALVEGICAGCWARPGPLGGLSRAGIYDGALRQSVLNWKFGGNLALGRYLGRLLVESYARAPWAGTVDAFVPVPQPWTRWLVRRFHPAGYLAAQLSDATGPPVLPILSARRCPPQVGLSERQRRDNVRNAFKLRGSIDLSGHTVCLVDDVMTTGATLEAAAGVLLAAGADRVYAAVIARTP